MRLGAAVLGLCLALAGAGSGAEQAQGLSPSAQELPEAYVARCSVGLDAELGLLDGGTLTQALRGLVAQGVTVRLLLDPASLDTRREGQALAALSASAQVRWSPKAGRPIRRLIGAQQEQMLWRSGAGPSRADGAWRAAESRFEAEWAKATPDLPEALRLEDELKRLPDPTEDQPHFIRRKDAAAREDSHADDQDP